MLAGVVLVLVALGALVWRQGESEPTKVSRAKPHAAEAVMVEAPKLKRRLPSIPDLMSIQIDQVPEVRLSDVAKPGAEGGNVIRESAISGFRAFVRKNSVTPLQERLLLALMADVEDDIRAVKAEEQELKTGPFRLRVAREVWENLSRDEQQQLARHERELRLKESYDLSDSAAEAIQADYDARARAILTADQFDVWEDYDLRQVSTLSQEGPFTESAD